MIDKAMRPITPALLAWLSWTALFLAVGISTIGYNSMRHPVAGLFEGAATGGVIALVGTGIAAAISRRRVTAVDVFRIGCWALIGISLGLKAAIPPPGYFTYINGYYPSYMAAVGGLTTAAIVAALVAIPASLVVFPLPPPPKPGHCTSCGYDLTGNVSGVCPECGEEVLSGRNVRGSTPAIGRSWDQTS